MYDSSFPGGFSYRRVQLLLCCSLKLDGVHTTMRGFGFCDFVIRKRFNCYVIEVKGKASNISKH